MRDLEERLRRLLGLSGYEARVYLAVLQGATRPREIAEEANVPPQRIYDVLRSLQRRGLVAQTGDGYQAVPPSRSLLVEAERLLAEASEKAEELRRLARELERRVAHAAREYVAVEEGVHRAVAAASAALEECGEKPWIMAYKAAEKAVELLPVLQPLLSLLAGRGARVIVYRGARVPEEALQQVGRLPGVEVRVSDAVLLDMMVACDTVVIGAPGRAGSVVAVVAVNQGFADALKRRIEAIWRDSEPPPGGPAKP
ncbi:hypothetical protein CF15_08055 [Pyrodictium occultum]|uniref:Transcription regulator TrmB N-terminal domain-containing protein n=1 Tax=Pyrodictium occultum TaxID=2309 RepID=A0A0V8RS07_PYROC|nr:helix-turn-helix domain-containing protein [Pyrodictium occultum]KSW10728.1 hypothetical protein CF15_08055 [Pyrodictium occultum]